MYDKQIPPHRLEKNYSSGKLLNTHDNSIEVSQRLFKTNFYQSDSVRHIIAQMDLLSVTA
jgi:hypothetical protein